MHHTFHVEHTFHSQRETRHQYTIALSIHTTRNVSAGNKQTGRRSQYLYTGLATVFRPNIQLNTQSLNFPLLANAISSRLILKLSLWLLLLLLLPSSNNTTTMITDSTSGTTIHNKLVETETHQGEAHEYSSLLWGQARHTGCLAFIRYPFVAQQPELPKPLYLPRMRGPTLILAQSGARWGFPPRQPQPVGLVPTVSFAHADSSNSRAPHNKAS